MRTKYRLHTLRPRVNVLPPRVPPPPKQVDSIYRTPEWTTLVKQLQRERGILCEKCGTRGSRIFADHIKELKDGGSAFDKSNLQLLCGACHSSKTAAERARRTAIR